MASVGPLRGPENEVDASTPRHAALRATRRGAKSFRPLRGRHGLRPAPPQPQCVMHKQVGMAAPRGKVAGLWHPEEIVAWAAAARGVSAGLWPARPQRGRSDLTSRRVARRAARRGVNGIPPLLEPRRGSTGRFFLAASIAEWCLLSSWRHLLRAQGGSSGKVGILSLKPYKITLKG